MAIVDVSIIPVGTGNPSVSEYVAEVQKVLEKNADRVKYQLTPMNTVIEGDLPVLLEVIQQMHEVPYIKGAKRVATTIRIDDRRDKESTMEKKLNSVRSKL
ncbi:MTH1187 family thiamine-binding protein [Bacillus pseudomycoides]|uniref:MTH1187 family thiamine-binding protein n=1 Tax=Bacillus bingmayongensis TaxID=1150157 RepID=A0ABU5JTH8_9BACI|nr:MTH1187 family thiamine-binding protein [Bacillus pseudomycoides]